MAPLSTSSPSFVALSAEYTSDSTACARPSQQSYDNAQAESWLTRSAVDATWFLAWKSLRGRQHAHTAYHSGANAPSSPP
jgi:hypothetical protein